VPVIDVVAGTMVLSLPAELSTGILMPKTFLMDPAMIFRPGMRH
jgi:hypothetical protein